MIVNSTSANEADESPLVERLRTIWPAPLTVVLKVRAPFAATSGMSWSAFTALRVSARRPAALKALILGGVSEDGWRTDIHNLGGALYAARVDWAGVMLGLPMLHIRYPAARVYLRRWWKMSWWCLSTMLTSHPASLTAIRMT